MSRDPDKLAGALALLSGLAALVYEIVWMRLFTPVFGLSVYATTAVLCAFMGGLGLGSLAAPRLLARWRRSPWALYAALELGVALGALGVLGSVGPITRAYVATASQDLPALLVGAVRFSLSFAAMAVPTFFMGVTLPALASAAGGGEGEHGGARIGRLYGLNTAGGAIGCLLAGFWLLPELGTRATALTTMGLSGLVAVLALLVGARLGGAAPGPREEARPGGAGGQAGLLVAAAVVGAVSMGFELSWFRMLVFYLQSAAQSFSLMLTTYLLGIGLGSLIFARLIARRLRALEQATRAFCLALLAIGLCGALTLPVFTGLPAVWSVMLDGLGAGSWEMIAAQKAVISGLLVLPTTLLFGLTLPLAARLARAGGASEAAALSRIYAASTTGSILGSLVTGFVLFEALGLQFTLGLLSVLCAATGLLLGHRTLRGARARPAAALLVGLLAALALTPGGLIRSSYARYLGPILFYRESASDVTFVYEVDGDRWLGFSDGRGTSSTSPQNEYHNRMNAYEAMLLRPEARNVLVISMGSGNTASAFLAFPIERLDIVDISSGPFEAAPLFWTNHGALQDPRVHLTVEDGRNYLLKTRRTYDVIEIELPSLHTDGVAFLYTREFYQIAAAHLEQGGVISQWIDADQTRRWPSYRLVHTAADVLSDVSVWGTGWSWWILGRAGGATGAPPYEQVRAAFERPEVRADMARVGTSLEDILANLVAYGPPLTEAIATAPPITDDQTWIDFALPKVATPTSLGGGVGYYNAPLRSLFERAWRRGGGIREEGLTRFFPGGEAAHDAACDRSLRAFAAGYPEDLLARVQEINGR